MTSVEKISRKIACLIDEEIKGFGYKPAEFYKKNKLSKKILRIRKGESFTCSGIHSILSAAESGLNRV